MQADGEDTCRVDAGLDRHRGKHVSEEITTESAFEPPESGEVPPAPWVEAFLFGAEPPIADPPSWLERLEGQVVLAHVLADVDVDELVTGDRLHAPQADGTHLVAIEAGQTSEASEHDGSIPALDALLRDVAHLDCPVAVVVAPGVLGANAILGEAPRRLAALVDRAPRRAGIYVDAHTRSRVRAPLLALSDGLYRVGPGRKRWAWAKYAVAAAALLVGLSSLLSTTSRPDDTPHIFVNIAEVQRGAAGRVGDRLVVSVTGAPGRRVTLLLLDSTDLLVYAPVRRNQTLDTQGQLTFTMRFDNVPGKERFVALVADAPIKGLDTMVINANVDGKGRTDRLDLLRERLKQQQVAVVPSVDLEHRP